MQSTDNGDLIFSYTIDQATEDGLLFDIRTVNPQWERGIFSHVTTNLPEISSDDVMKAIREAFDREMERKASMATVICRRCLHGYIVADDMGYDPCPQCHGENCRLVEPDEAEDLDGEWDIIYPATYRLKGEDDND